MKSIYRFLTSVLIVSGFSHSVHSQGLPPGWDYNPTPSNHIISIPVSAQPNINGYLLYPGDYIGVFYTDDDGNLVCGGATDWLGDQNTGIIAFGDDAFTGDKDGFSSGESITYKFYSWKVNKEYDAEAICNDGLPVTCASFVSNGLSGVDSLWANGYYIVAGANPDSVCFGDQTQLFVEPSGGSGNYTFNWSSDPVGFSSTLPDPVVTPTENTIYTAAVQDGDETLEITVSVEVFQGPSAYAGPDITICEDSLIMVTGTYNNSSDFVWSTEGDGTFDDVNLLSPQYAPGPQDINNGGVQLGFTAFPVAPCTESVSDMMELTIVGLPEVDAGTNQTVCEDQQVALGATLLNAIEILWETTGDGSFENPNQIETTYYQGTGDILTGMVEISAIAQSLVPCVATSQDQLQVSFGYLPDVFAGDDQVICETGNVLLSGMAENSNVFSWETSGDGTFENMANLETTYYPGAEDKASGEVEITLNCEALSPCAGSFSDDLIVDIVAEPIVNAGDDVTICETGNLQINGTATSYDEILWTTNGDGTFSDSNNLNTNYYPGPEDILSLQVQIQITAQPLYPCNNQTIDSMVLYIVEQAEVDAGEDFTIPLGEDYLTQGEAINYSTSLWTSSGDGVFDDPLILETSYLPGIEDENNAGATLFLAANPIDPCVAIAQDQMILTIDTVTTVQSFDPHGYISIFPNPNNGIFYIDIQNDKVCDMQIYAYDNTGKKIFEFDFEGKSMHGLNRLQIDLRKHKAGIYVIQVVKGGQSFSEKIFLSKAL